MDAFLFDLDGTLIDSRDDIAASVNFARQAVGLPPLEREGIYPLIGEGARRLIERALGPEHGRLVEDALEAWRRHYGEHLLDTTRVFPGIHEALGRLNGCRAVVTNKPGEHARRLVEALGLSELCPVVVGGGDVPSRKPDPEGVALALSKLPTARRAVLIGDSAVDAATARAAGLGFVGVLWGLGSREQMEAEGARVFARHPAELPELALLAASRKPKAVSRKP